jgi:hypothetical protein
MAWVYPQRYPPPKFGWWVPLGVYPHHCLHYSASGQNHLPHHCSSHTLILNLACSSKGGTVAYDQRQFPPQRCSAAIFPGRTTPLLTSHATFLRVSIPYPSTPMSIRSDLQPSAVILYPLSRIRISTARILHILCPILVHACSGSSVSFSPFFPYRFPLLYLCPLLYPLFACPGFSVAASDAFGLPFFLLRLTVLGMPGL